MRSLLGITTFLVFQGCSLATIEDSCTNSTPGISESWLTGTLMTENTVSFSVTGPSNETALSIADVLANNSINGSFFVTGKQIDENLSNLTSIYNLGHTVSNGSYTSNSLLNTRDPAQEVRRTDFLITPFVRNNQFLFRPPLEQFDERLAKRLNQDGLVKYVGPIGHDHEGVSDTACWADSISVEDCASDYVTEILSNDRGIIEVHSDDARSINLSQTIISSLLFEGFTFVDLNDVPNIAASLAANGATLDSNVVETCNDYD